MSYQSSTIATVVNRLNVQYFLPAIQREFVWKPEQVVKLFDSILRGYPISSFLFWELKPENREKWEVYKFISDFNELDTHNELANTNGVQQLTLVLDGQQRLTSLLIGLKGSYTVKKKYVARNNPNATVRQKLYIDLLHDSKLNQSDDSEVDLRYNLKFFENPPANVGKDSASLHYWLEVGKILDFASQDAFDDFSDSESEKLPDSVTKGQQRIFKNNLDRLYKAIWENLAVAYYTEQDQDYDRVLDIFVRANDGGTKLSKSDLLLSLVTSKWSGMNARDEIFGFVDYINRDLDRRNDFDKDFLMKNCLALTDLPVAYKVENFNNANLNLIHSQWQSIKNAVEASLRLVNSFGIDRDTLTSTNALIPIIYYVHKYHIKSLLGNSEFDVRNSAAIRTWLLTTLLNNVFSGQSDNAITYARSAIQKQDSQNSDFPIEEINRTIAQAGRKPYFDEFAVDDFLTISYGKRETFLALSILYDEKNWGTIKYQQDHIFPQSLFKLGSLSKSGLSPEKQNRYLELYNRIGNLELLSSDENLAKSNISFEGWLPTRDSSFCRKHLIPENNELLKFENFEEFIEAREELIRQRLRNLFSPLKSDLDETLTEVA